MLGGYLILLITAGSDFYKHLSTKRIVPSRYLKTNLHETSHWFQLFQKPQRADDCHERTDDL